MNVIPPFPHLLAQAGLQGLPFLLIGGHAVFAHGHPRTTLDVDLIIPENSVSAWKNWVELHHYTLLQETPAFLQFQKTCESGPPLDLMKTDPKTYQQLESEHLKQDFAGTTLPVVSLFHLLALKLHSLKSSSRQLSSDLQDILILVRKNRIDPASPRFQDILSQYADTKTKTKVLRLLQE